MGNFLAHQWPSLTIGVAILLVTVVQVQPGIASLIALVTLAPLLAAFWCAARFTGRPDRG
jgi:hypothetical protein